MTESPLQLVKGLIEDSGKPEVVKSVVILFKV